MMLAYSFVLLGLFLTVCNAQNDKTVEEELDALLLDLDSGGRRNEELTSLDTREKILDQDQIRFQSMGIRRGWLGCPNSVCDIRKCASYSNRHTDFNQCWGEVFQIIGEGNHQGDPITSGQRVRIKYPRGSNEWFACVDRLRCDKRTCPGTLSQGYNFNRCGGEVFYIYARGREHGEDIANGDLTMLFGEYIDRKYVAANGQNDGDDVTVDYCPGERPPAYLTYAICPKNVWRIYKRPAS